MLLFYFAELRLRQDWQLSNTDQITCYATLWLWWIKLRFLSELKANLIQPSLFTLSHLERHFHGQNITTL